MTDLKRLEFAVKEADRLRKLFEFRLQVYILLLRERQ